MNMMTYERSEIARFNSGKLFYPLKPKTQDICQET